MNLLAVLLNVKWHARRPESRTATVYPWKELREYLSSQSLQRKELSWFFLSHCPKLSMCSMFLVNPLKMKNINSIVFWLWRQIFTFWQTFLISGGKFRALHPDLLYCVYTRGSGNLTRCQQMPALADHAFQRWHYVSTAPFLTSPIPRRGGCHLDNEGRSDGKREAARLPQAGDPPISIEATGDPPTTPPS